MEVTPFINPVFTMLKTWDNLESKKITLGKMLTAECHFNLKLLDMLRWQNVSPEFQNHICLHLQTEVAEMTLAFVDSEFLHFLSKKVNSIQQLLGKNIQDDKNESTIVSLITRIKAIKILCGLPENLQKDNKSRMESRLNNLKDIILVIIKNLETIKPIKTQKS